MRKNNPSLSLSRLTCIVPNYKFDIEILAKAKSSDPLYIEFAQRFLSYIPVDYNFDNRKELFANFIGEAFEFFKHNQSNINKIGIKQTIVENDPAISVFLIRNNKSFIVDSILCLLSRLGLQAKFILHPVLQIIRDSNGELIEIARAGGKIEVLVHLVIIGSFDHEAMNFLSEQITETLNQVDKTHDIWQETLLRIEDINDKITTNKNVDNSENSDFLEWLKNDNFTFLGFVDFEVQTGKLTLERGVRSIWQAVTSEIRDIITYSANSLYKDNQIILGKLNSISLVHKDSLVDYILIKDIDINGNYHNGSIIFGLYSSKVNYQSVSTIPILRKKMQFVLDKANFLLGGYNHKKLRTIIESLPKEALIQIDQGDLYCMSLYILSSLMSKKLKLFVQQDWSGSFINIIVVLPNERLNSEVHNAIDSYIEEKFASKIIASNLSEISQNFSYLFITLGLSEQIDLDVVEIENDLNHISSCWNDDLYQELSKKLGDYEVGRQLKNLESVFTSDYKHKFTAKTALQDVEYLIESTRKKRIMFNFCILDDQNFTLKIYNIDAKLSLSSILPLIENLGFSAIDQQSFHVSKSEEFDESWIYKFRLISSAKLDQNKFTRLKLNIENTLDKMQFAFLSNDMLNKLVLLAGLEWHEVKLIKAIVRYLHQINPNYDKLFVQNILTKYHNFAGMLIELFHALFDPENKKSDVEINLIKTEIEIYLTAISNNLEEQVLRSIFHIVQAMTRTNYYQDKENKSYISFKLKPSLIPNIVKPIPFAEIFVYSNEFEGVHLRGAKISRGGLRWSDREHDYRTEILGLMKAQMTKNTVIVPEGAKGGFFVHIPQESLAKVTYHQKIIECYKNFLRGLLDVTDNIIDGKVHVANSVIYDEQDPYLVVAADKGTASFSDYANDISKEYNFWLGDAFASGGSAGYDHKKMAITSKGAWISVINHFSSLNIDPSRDSISVVGIGDMSGDVFGNGMLRSKSIKLLASFNHMHIFVDPSPDPILSFEERNRLFNLPGSSWSNYNPNLISLGGGVFERSAKFVNISPQMKELLKIDDDTLSTDNLIMAILMAPVDLIWNGGIGTYIKSTGETHADIGDKSNDNLRCNGKNIRAKIICEGGNLGVSQLGRIEYCLNGGKINADFIDNSGGVSCSDHEVNIKIALDIALTSKKITLEERNKFLAIMTSEVEELVLEDNYKQNQALNILSSSPIFTLNMFSQFIDNLEKLAFLNRQLEFLPSHEDLALRADNSLSLTRPELAVIISYSKMSLFNALSDIDVTNDPYFEKYLINYFPKSMYEKFKSDILSHPLKNEIIQTSITNNIINKLSGVLIHNIQNETDAKISDIVKYYIIVCEIFDLDKLWFEVESLSASIDYNIKISIFTEIINTIYHTILWLIKHTKESLHITKTIDRYQVDILPLCKSLSELLLGSSKNKYEEKLESYCSNNIGLELAKSLAILDRLKFSLDIIHIAEETKKSISSVAKLYFLVEDQLHIDYLSQLCDNQIKDSLWHRFAVHSLKDDLYDKHSQLLIKLLKNPDELIQKNYLSNVFIKKFLDLVDVIKLKQNIDLNFIILANKKFQTLLEKLE